MTNHQNYPMEYLDSCGRSWFILPPAELSDPQKIKFCTENIFENFPIVYKSKSYIYLNYLKECDDCRKKLALANVVDDECLIPSSSASVPEGSLSIMPPPPPPPSSPQESEMSLSEFLKTFEFEPQPKLGQKPAGNNSKTRKRKRKNHY
jgi:hypothetical protein